MCTSKKKKLAVIGGSYLQQPLVKRANEMGIETHCFAWEKGAVCKEIADYFYPLSITEKEAILEKCREIGIDGITTIASDLAVLTVNYIATKLGLTGNEDEYALTQTNKYQMRKCFLENNVPSPKFTLVDSDKNYNIKGFKFPVIVKPTDRSGSRGVEKVWDNCELDNAINRAIKESFSHEAIIEEFVSGREISVETISYNGNHYILQLTDKVTTGEPYFVELEHHQPSTLPQEIQAKIKVLVPHALDALHIKYGASHSEIKISDEGEIRFIEIGARMGGDFIGSDLVKLSTGYDFLKGVIDVALGEFEEPVLKYNNNSGVYFLSADTPNIKDYIESSDNYPEIVKAEVTDPVLHLIQESADRSGYFIYQANKRFII